MLFCTLFLDISLELLLVNGSSLIWKAENIKELALVLLKFEFNSEVICLSELLMLSHHEASTILVAICV